MFFKASGGNNKVVQPHLLVFSSWTINQGGRRQFQKTIVGSCFYRTLQIPRLLKIYALVDITSY